VFDDFLDDETEELLDEWDSGSAGANAVRTLLPPRESPDLFGHEGVEKQTLSMFESGQMPHSLIFAGPMGVGKMTMAFRVARYFLSRTGGEDDITGGLFGSDDHDAAPLPKPNQTMQIPPDSPVFRRVASGGHPDLRTIERPIDEKRGRVKSVVDVEAVRTIAPFLRMKSSEGGWRVVIVDEADMMNRNAQNAILKILEEPPPKALLILICNRLGAMLPTIRSRCRVLHFGMLDTPSMAAIIRRADPSISDAKIALLSQIAGGSAGRALALLEDGGLDMLNIVTDLLSAWPQWPWPSLHQLADSLARAEEEKNYGHFTALMLWIVESITKAKAAGTQYMPEILKTPPIERMAAHYSLEDWLDICEKLKEHFITIENSNLDKRQGVLGTFVFFNRS